MRSSLSQVLFAFDGEGFCFYNGKDKNLTVARIGPGRF